MVDGKKTALKSACTGNDKFLLSFFIGAVLLVNLVRRRRRIKTMQCVNMPSMGGAG